MTDHSLRVLLLRGVNVSGANKLPMAEFRAMLSGLGLAEVQTYIQSGNAVFRTDEDADVLTARIQAEIDARFGFSPELFLLSAKEIVASLTDHPFIAAPPERVHVFFLRKTPASLDEDGLSALAVEGDAWHLAPGRFTLFTPAGIGRSKLADKLHKFIPGQMTARNLRTIAALADMTAS